MNPLLNPLLNPFVRRLAHGARLSEDDRAALHHLTRHVRVHAAGSVLVAEDEPVPCMFVVLEGWACLCQVTAEGRRQITDLVLPGDACNRHAAMLASYDHTFATLTACRIARVDQTELDRRPGVRQALDWSTFQTENILRAALTNNGRREAEFRIAHLICEMRARLESVGLVERDAFAWPLTQTDVADATSLTSVHVNRTFKTLREAGLFTLEHRLMQVPDAGRLAAFCDFRPSYLHLSSGSASEAAAASGGDRP